MLDHSPVQYINDTLCIVGGEGHGYFPMPVCIPMVSAYSHYSVNHHLYLNIDNADINKSKGSAVERKSCRRFKLFGARILQQNSPSFTQ